MENRRGIAEYAAKAWAVEAAAADAREFTHKTHDDIDIAITEEFAREVKADKLAKSLARVENK